MESAFADLPLNLGIRKVPGYLMRHEIQRDLDWHTYRTIRTEKFEFNSGPINSCLNFNVTQVISSKNKAKIVRVLGLSCLLSCADSTNIIL